MTLWQSIMLSACFGFTLGMMISTLITAIQLATRERKEKKRRKNEEETNLGNANME